MKKDNLDDLQKQLSRFLFHYRGTPHSTIGTSPTQLLMSRRIKTHLDLLHPSLAAHVGRAQYHQKRNHDRSSQPRQFAIVFVRNFNSGSQWIAGVIPGLRGPMPPTVQLNNKRIVRWHVDHVRARTVPCVAAPIEDLPLPTPTTISSQPDPTPANAPEQALRRSTHPPPTPIRRPQFDTMNMDWFPLKGRGV